MGLSATSFIFDTSIELPDNAFLKHKLDLVNEWDFKRNDELGINIYKVTKGTAKVVWWLCPKCKSSYERRIDQQNSSMKERCVYCSGHKINHTNSLLSIYPHLASQWHPTKNGDLTPDRVGYKSANKVWWKCEKEHEWITTIASRHRGTGCPYCSGRHAVIGVTDMWTTNASLAKLLANPEDGYKYTQSSNMKVDWKCPECDNILKNKDISNINNQGLSCNLCKGGKSYPEKYMNSLLKQLNLKFDNEKTFTWAKNKRYDFYLSSLDTIIEMHGIQHYERSFKSISLDSLEEVQENDRFKLQKAIENKIRQYVVIDARYSDSDYIKKNILKSSLSSILDLSNVDWKLCSEEATKSTVKEVCLIYDESEDTVKEISEKMKLDVTTVYEYIKIGTKNGWCNYKPYSRGRKKKELG